MGFLFDIAMESTHKYAVSESGDVCRVVDLPDGGVAVVVVDGQGSGPAARIVARSAAEEASRLLTAGAMAETAARATSEALYFAKQGKVSVSLDTIRIGRKGTIDIARFSTNSLVVYGGDRWRPLDDESGPAGRYERQQPALCQLDAADVSTIVIVTDGIAASGRRLGREVSLVEAVQELDGEMPATDLAHQVLSAAFERDEARPADDMTVLAVRIESMSEDQRYDQLQFRRVTR